MNSSSRLSKRYFGLLNYLLESIEIFAFGWTLFKLVPFQFISSPSSIIAWSCILLVRNGWLMKMLTQYSLTTLLLLMLMLMALKMPLKIYACVTTAKHVWIIPDVPQKIPLVIISDFAWAEYCSYFQFPFTLLVYVGCTIVSRRNKRSSMWCCTSVLIKCVQLHCKLSIEVKVHYCGKFLYRWSIQWYFLSSSEHVLQ